MLVKIGYVQSINVNPAPLHTHTRTHTHTGKTMLYVPHDDLSQPETCAKDKDLCQRLEASVIHWTRLIKGLVNGAQVSCLYGMEKNGLREKELMHLRKNYFKDSPSRALSTAH